MADSAILTGVVATEVGLGLAVLALPSWLAIALVVIDQLDALLGAKRGAWIGEAFIDISLAPWSDESRSASALIASDLVHADTSMVAGSLKALIDIDLAQETHGAVGT